MIAFAWKLALISALAWLPAGLQPQQATPAPAATPAAAPVPATPAPAASPVKVEDQASFIVVGMTVRTSRDAEASGQGQIPQLWQNAFTTGQLDQIPNRVGDGVVVVYSDYTEAGEYNYTLGVRVSSADTVPVGMVKRVIPAGKYAVVQSETGAPQEVIPAMWARIGRMTPAEMGGTRAYQVDFETYPAIADFNNMQSTAHLGLK
ncbi:MAG TPA: GyrI-like domain-containing protein [Acidobacteriaceae bacterium]|jgi:predicted transcriptional regulator YdeE|nr:GyrI-like domain-containing protein [Acidobacteriaceae bacterium]